MDRQAAKEILKSREPDFLEPAPQKVNGRTSYICPKCKNGEGSSGTGIARDKTGHYKCFVCGLYEDVIGLWMYHTNTQDAGEAFRGLYAYYGLQVDNLAKEEYRPAPAYQKQDKTEQYTHSDIHTNTYTQTETAKDCMCYFRECMGRIGETDYPRKRGLGEAVIKKYMLGFDPHFKTKDGYTGEYTEWKALIIPTGKGSYVARNTDPATKDKNRLRIRGTSQIYNLKTLTDAQTPIFITEGELDALSIIEVGGSAVALGGAGKRNRLLSEIKRRKPAQPLVVALDNDTAGDEGARELIAELEREEIPFYRYNAYGDKKDANEALQSDRAALQAAIAKAEDLEREASEAEREAYLQTSTANYLQDFIDGIADSVNTPYIPTGYEHLDRELDGGLYEGLYITGAISSLGKTTLITSQMCDQIAKAGEDVLIFSLEMARSELMAKSISRETLLDVMQNNGDTRDAKTTRGITTGVRYLDYSPTEKELIQRATMAYGEYAGNIYIHEGVGDIGASEIRETVRKHILFTGKRPVVVIDYLQILAPADVRATDKQNTDKAVLELKRISRDFKIPVVGISSFNRDNYTAPVNLASFKESGSIEYSSDVLIGMQLKGAGGQDFNANEAKKKNPREIELVILKSRNGAAGAKIAMEYYSLFNYFREI